MNEVTQIRYSPNRASDPIDDASLLAGYAVDALQNRRYALAVELAKLSERAARVGVRPAGHDAAQRDLFGPGGTAIVPLIGQTRQEEPRDASHAPNTCCVPIMGQGLEQQQCGMPIRYSDGSNGAPVGWYHLAADITDHEALPY